MWDVIIVGTGVGGSTLGRVLAETGRFRILFIEKGVDSRASPGRPNGFPETWPEFRRKPAAIRDETLRRAGRMTEQVEDAVRGDSFVPFLGSGPGGSSALYGMAMERMFASDLDRGWPVGSAEFDRWYGEAEQMYGVRGTADPLRPVGTDSALEDRKTPLSAANEVVFADLCEQGLHPYRQHLARETVEGCEQCQGFLCARACKNDALRIGLEPALAHAGVELMSGASVELLEKSEGSWTVHCVRSGEASQLRARAVVLAAGALQTPRILMQSGLEGPSGLVGRRLMKHAIDLFALSSAPSLETEADAKELALSDFYESNGMKLGVVQAFGLPPPVAYLRNGPSRMLWRLLGPLANPIAAHFARTPIVAGILEDSPDRENGVEVRDGRLGMHYRLSDADTRRRKTLRGFIKHAFRRFGIVRVAGDDRAAIGHVCGTCCFGDDPATSVLDRWNRVHHLDNLFVVDSSFFPTSSGVNPALTIAANALRVGNHLAEVL